MHSLSKSTILSKQIFQESCPQTCSNQSFWLSNKFKEAFNLKGFRQLWKPSDDELAEEVFGEVYASAAFREMEDEIHLSKPPGDMVKSVVVHLIVYSDSTHLATFGMA